jgi:hypothetical protein
MNAVAQLFRGGRLYDGNVWPPLLQSRRADALLASTSYTSDGTVILTTRPPSELKTTRISPSTALPQHINVRYHPSTGRRQPHWHYPFQPVVVLVAQSLSRPRHYLETLGLLAAAAPGLALRWLQSKLHRAVNVLLVVSSRHRLDAVPTASSTSDKHELGTRRLLVRLRRRWTRRSRVACSRSCDCVPWLGWCSSSLNSAAMRWRVRERKGGTVLMLVERYLLPYADERLTGLLCCAWGGCR